MRNERIPWLLPALMVAGSLLGSGAVAAPAYAGEFELKEDEQGVTVKVDGKLFTRYLKRSGAKPILWPLVGPSGKEMTRGYPMRDATKDEKQDHIHHRSMWFTHGDVNGISFWHETKGHGNIVHKKFTTVEGGKTGVIESVNDWIAPSGKRQCQDRRRFVFHADSNRRWIDVELTVTATDGPVTFGDTKEGCFGVRVAGTMRTERPDGGTIVNSRGDRNKDAWGKQAEWVDYYGPVDGETVGIAIMNHPSSFRYPTYWHVRTYGLFTANPFGWHDFQRDRSLDGSKKLEPGESFTLRYRMLIHLGDNKKGNVAQVYQDYAAGDGRP